MNHPKTGGAWLQVELPGIVANSDSQDYIWKYLHVWDYKCETPPL
jgi:hypothetical protein